MDQHIVRGGDPANAGRFSSTSHQPSRVDLDAWRTRPNVPRPLALDVWQYEADADTSVAYSTYLADWDHPVLYADDFETWLSWNSAGQYLAEQVEIAVDTGDG